MSAQVIDQTRLPRWGDRVQIRGLPAVKGRIIAFRGPIGHRGAELFEVEIVTPDYTRSIVVPREELVYLDDGHDPDHPNPPAAPATE